MSETAPGAADCLFCKIIAGDVPADVVHETDTTVAFRDIDPQAPTHVLVIPKRHEPDLVALATADPGAATDVLRAVGDVAAQEQLGEGYRSVFNTGALAQQSVFHAHVHVLGGRAMTWPPG
ncbi:MAG TPA: histidine triad nucleotide-binding protein [Segeticoccus sp.]|uniref:histidine triad nucleotide-binding protein n=1 Tax=Segeticoccus sp. TaxID=2706531 RepID=UPI002D7F4E71|nr:histidine triad nucleotide-binding protein [Segeticoccus sp.]HET8599589.1 histidine triad nucleotide-binding protein [Segeticoccus sp.]